MDSYRNKLIIKTSPQKLYEAITTAKGLASWWTDQIELYPQLGGTATFRFQKDVYVVMKIGKLVPGKTVVWKCVEQYFPMKGTEKTDEWVGTTVRFEILENKDGTTMLTFIHEGLIEDLFCYESCKKAWDEFLESLKNYLETGTGAPYISK